MLCFITYLQDSNAGKGKRKRTAKVAAQAAESLSDSDVELIPYDAVDHTALGSGSNNSSSSAKMDSGFSITAGDSHDIAHIRMLCKPQL
jgi:hypothetical protein